MTFADIIQNNRNSLAPSIKWWTKYAFHYTDIMNALSILQSGKLFSRTKAQAEHLMKNDNASYQVIDATALAIQSYVRFYFRPLTPTQYYNEGYKPPKLRYDSDQNANVPVPIFFAFNLEKLLSDPNVKFSEFSQAGYGSRLLSGADDFSKLAFDKIYSDGLVDSETRKYRHAELLYPDFYPIKDSLEAILCRNEFEQSMLLSMLYRQNEKAFYEYKPFIKVCREKMFEKNGLFLQNVQLDKNKISFSFADSYAKRQYAKIAIEKNNLTEPLEPLKLVFTFEWRQSKNLLKQISVESDFDYQEQHGVVFTIPQVARANILSATVKCNNDLIGYKEFILAEII